MPNVSKIEVDEIGGATGTTLTLTTGHVITGSTGQFQISGGTAGQALTTDGTGNLTFSDAGASVTIADDPPSSPSTGDLWWESDTGILKVYYNDGTTSQWVDATPQDAPIELPSQSTHAGKYLQTDGTILSWATVTHPDPTMGGDLTGTASNAQIAAGAVGTAEIATDAVTANEIAADAVGTAMIADNAVTADKIASGVLENPNVVINGGFDIWQRGVSLTSSSYYNMYADRWMGDAYNNTGNTISRQSGTASEPFYYFLRFQRDASNTGTGMRRVGTVFESRNTRFMCGQEVTLSFYARKGANWSPTDSFTSVIFTGTGNDESMNLGQGSAWTGYAQQTQSNTLTTSWQRFTHTVTLSATAQQVGLQFLAQAASGTAGADDYFDLGGVKLELGGVATPFMNKGFGQELAACQRYYQKASTTTPYTGPCTNGVTFGGEIYFANYFRGTPTVTTAHVTSSSFPGTTPTAGTIQKGKFYCTKVADGTSSVGYFRMSWTADAEL